MDELSIEHCALYASCFIVGLFTGYKMKRPLQIITNLALKEPTKLVLVVRDDLRMGKGKIVSQCCHGTLASYIKAKRSHPELLNCWELGGQAKVVVKVKSLQELMKVEKEAVELGVPSCLIRDAGRTQITSGTETVLSVGPDIISNIDKITGHLKLL